MAIGDDAAAAGLPILSPVVDKVIDGAQEINRTRDFIAQRTSTVQPIAKGGTGATTAAAARTALGVPSATQVTADISAATTPKLDSASTSYVKNTGGGRVQFGWIGGGRIQVEVSGFMFPTPMAYMSDVDYVRAGNMHPDIYSRTVGGNSVYISSAGLLGYLPSTARLKDIHGPWVLDAAAARAVLVQVYTYLEEVGLGTDDQVGLIAEDLVALGFGWLVGFDQDGLPMTVHYDRVGVLALALAQHEAARVDQLEAALVALQEDVAALAASTLTGTETDQ